MSEPTLRERVQDCSTRLAIHLDAREGDFVAMLRAELTLENERAVRDHADALIALHAALCARHALWERR